MFTKAMVNNMEVTVLTQQYEIGTYFIINNEPSLQGSSPLKERDYHIKIRKKILNNNDILIDGTILDYKGKLKLNEFKT